MEPIRIELPFINCSTRRDCVKKECHLILEPEAISYKMVGTFLKKNDDTDIWEPKKSNYRWTRKRQNMSEVDMAFDNTENLYAVNIDFFGISEGNGWFFENPKEALSVYNQLVEYMTYKTEFTPERISDGSPHSNTDTPPISSAG